MTLMLAVAVTVAALIAAVFSVLQRAERDKIAKRYDQLSGFGVLQEGMRSSIGER